MRLIAALCVLTSTAALSQMNWRPERQLNADQRLPLPIDSLEKG